MKIPNKLYCFYSLIYTPHDVALLNIIIWTCSLVGNALNIANKISQYWFNYYYGVETCIPCIFDCALSGLIKRTTDVSVTKGPIQPFITRNEPTNKIHTIRTLAWNLQLSQMRTLVQTANWILQHGRIYETLAIFTKTPQSVNGVRAFLRLPQSRFYLQSIHLSTLIPIHYVTDFLEKQFISLIKKCFIKPVKNSVNFNNFIK